MTIGQTPQHYTVVATADGNEYSAMTIAGAPAGAGAGNIGASIIGFADHDYKSGQSVRVNYDGISMAVAGGTIDASSERRLKTAANGTLILWTANSIPAALLAPGEPTALVSGQKIRVFPLRHQAATAT